MTVTLKRLAMAIGMTMILAATAAGVLTKYSGQTDVTVYFYATDTAGEPNTAPVVADYDAYYIKEGLAISAKVDLQALADANSAHTDNRAYGTGLRGMVRVDWPDAAFTGATGSTVELIVVDGTGDDVIFPVTVQLGAYVGLVDGVDIVDPNGHVLANLVDASESASLLTSAYATVEAAVAATLNAAIDANATANSVFERIMTFDDAYTAVRAAYLDDVAEAGIDATWATAVSNAAAYTAFIMNALIDTAQMTVDANDTNRSFSLDTGSQEDDFYYGRLLVVQETATGFKDSSWITDYVGSTRTVTLGRALAFVPQAGDVVFIWNFKQTGGR